MSTAHGKQQALIKPPALKAGDRVGIISPAGPIRQSELSFGIAHLESAGFTVHLAPHVYDQKDYLAGDDLDRLADFREMFADPEIRAVFCTRGGYGTLRLLDRIDYDTIRRHPKILVGYSDITALMMALCKRSGLVTFHGPMMARLPSKPEHALTHLYEILAGRQPVTIHGEDGHALIGGRAAGPVVGGNLTLLCHLLGTPFFPPLDRAILLLEDRGEALYRLDRMLTHLTQAGQLSNLVGVVGGQFLDCGPMTAVNDLIETTFSKHHIPVVTGFPVGHGSENMTLPMGIRAELDTGQMTLSTLEPHVVMI